MEDQEEMLFVTYDILNDSRLLSPYIWKWINTEKGLCVEVIYPREPEYTDYGECKPTQKLSKTEKNESKENKIK